MLSFETLGGELRVEEERSLPLVGEGQQSLLAHSSDGCWRVGDAREEIIICHPRLVDAAGLGDGTRPLPGTSPRGLAERVGAER